MLKGLGYVLVIIALSAFVALIAGLFLMLGWNYGIVDAVEGTKKISVGTAICVALGVGALGAAWRGKSSNKNEDD